MDSPKYAQFDLSEVRYTMVNGLPIHAYVLVLKTTSRGTCPVTARFYSGLFISKINKIFKNKMLN